MEAGFFGRAYPEREGEFTVAKGGGEGSVASGWVRKEGGGVQGGRDCEIIFFSKVVEEILLSLEKGDTHQVKIT